MIHSMTNTSIKSALPLVLFCVAIASFAVQGVSQDEPQEPKIDFNTTIKPIIDARCATCHNEDDEQAGLNLNDIESFKEHVSVDDPLKSSLFQSITETNDMSLMPPEEDDDGNSLDPCSPSEIALIYMWIQQGASFEGAVPTAKKDDTRSSAYRMFLFSGFFHPAIVHFPIALITMSAVFIILFFKNDTLSDDAAFYLLLFGALSSIVACVFGWAFADYKYSGGVADFSSGVNRHRWVGIAGAVLATVSTVLGWRARNEVMSNRSGMWKFGVILTAAVMGIAGHQGGELVYGESFYEKKAQQLIPEYWPFAAEEKNKGEGMAEKNSENESGKSGDSPNAEKKNPSDSSDNASGNGGGESDKNSNENDSKTDESNDEKSGSTPTDHPINKQDN